MFFGVLGLGFWVWGLEFRGLGLGFFSVLGLRFRFLCWGLADRASDQGS